MSQGDSGIQFQLAVGGILRYRVTQFICSLCRSEIQLGNMCSYECPDDGEERAIRLKRMFYRTDELISEERVIGTTDERTTPPDPQTSSIQKMKG